MSMSARLLYNTKIGFLIQDDSEQASKRIMVVRDASKQSVSHLVDRSVIQNPENDIQLTLKFRKDGAGSCLEETCSASKV